MEPRQTTTGDDAAYMKPAVAAKLGVSVKTLDRMRERGEVPGVMQFGRCVRFNRTVIDAWVAVGCPKPEST